MFFLFVYIYFCWGGALEVPFCARGGGGVVVFLLCVLLSFLFFWGGGIFCWLRNILFPLGRGGAWKESFLFALEVASSVLRFFKGGGVGGGGRGRGRAIKLAAAIDSMG